MNAHVEPIEEARSVNGNLVQIVRPVKVCSTLSDVADFRHEMLRKLALNREIPLVDRRILDVWIEGPHGRSATD